MRPLKINNELLDTIKKLPRPAIIAISGFGGAGKSTIAKSLGTKLHAPVVSVDSFQKKGAFTTRFSLWQIMDFARLENEALKPFYHKDDVIRYGNFNATSESISETIEVKNNGMLIIEGVGLFRPELADYFTYTIWVDTPLEEAIARGKKRDRKENHNPTDEFWDGIWKQNDLEYYATFKPHESADVILKNTAF